MWYKGKIFRNIVYTLLILIIVYILSILDFIIHPIGNALKFVFIPLVISVLLYYLLKPLVNLLEKIKFPKWLAVMTVLVVFFSVIVLGIISIGDIAVRELSQLIDEIPGLIEDFGEVSAEFIGRFTSYTKEEISVRFSDAVSGFVDWLTLDISEGITKTVNIVAVLLIIPFLLAYLLLDDKKIFKILEENLPLKYREEGLKVLCEGHETFEKYISGTTTVILIGAVFMYLGYLLIGVRYALVLAAFTFFTAYIPILGDILGIIPAVVIALVTNPVKAIYIIILMIINEQVKANLLTPKIMGKKFKLHPLGVMLIILTAGALYGVMGMVLALPLYVLIKYVVKLIIEIKRVKKGDKKNEEAFTGETE